MRVLSVAFASAFVAAVGAAQTPAPSSPARPAARQAASEPIGDLNQVMRGILFPNSNLIFDVQSNDPGAPKKVEAGAGSGAAAAFANVYAGWEAVENAAVALGESADLVLKPGRLCSNGKPVPVQRADWVRLAEGLREAGRATIEAAKTRSQDKVIEVTDKVVDSCTNCHQVYRRGPIGGPARCTP